MNPSEAATPVSAAAASATQVSATAEPDLAEIIAHAEPIDEELPLPSFSEQISDQLGGVRGMVESSVPVVAFVLSFVAWELKPALIISVGAALALAAFRLSQRQPIRHAINGLFGIAIGAAIAWRTGSAKDFYLPGILISLGYAVAMVVSVLVRRPLVGWIWSVVADRGGTRWRDNAVLLRTFGWLTMLWAAIYFAKVGVQAGVYLSHALTDDQKASILGITRIALGYPPYALLLMITVWAVRRHTREPAAPSPAP